VAVPPPLREKDAEGVTVAVAVRTPGHFTAPGNGKALQIPAGRRAVADWVLPPTVMVTVTEFARPPLSVMRTIPSLSTTVPSPGSGFHRPLPGPGAGGWLGFVRAGGSRGVPAD
jgi:hypothetical protein